MKVVRERKRTTFRLVYRRDEHSREQERKLRKGMGGTERRLLKDYKMQRQKQNQTKSLQREFSRKLEAEGKGQMYDKKLVIFKG